MIYEVFARKERGEPLRHIGNLNAQDDALAQVYAFNTYDEERWFDMWVVPRDQMVPVFNREAEAGGWWRHEPAVETKAAPADGASGSGS
jgi:1,2-phenylacetyl-CoA epoxidase PaaB subunit